MGSKGSGSGNKVGLVAFNQPWQEGCQGEHFLFSEQETTFVEHPIELIHLIFLLVFIGIISR